MSIVPIITGKDHVTLRTPAKKVMSVTKKTKKIIQDLKDTLKNPTVHGVGLAAPQINIGEQIFIATINGSLQVFINPTIVSKSTTTNIDEEGCLSLPGVWGNVMRADSIIVEFLDSDGHKKSREYSGFEARIIQHEYDHLHGVLFIDYIQ